MKKIFWLILITGFLASGCSNDTPEIVKSKKTLTLRNHVDTVSYSLGVNIGKQLKKNGVDKINYNALIYAIYQVTRNIPEDSLMIHPEVADNILKIYFYYENKKKEEPQTKQPDWKRFFVRNRQKEGVEELCDGVQYIVLEQGHGKKIHPEDYVTVTYTGYKLNGKPFDQRYSNKPVTIKVSGTLKGWQMALTNMRKGDKWRVFIAPQYAFGNRAVNDLPPNSIVVYDIKIHDVKHLK